MADKKERLQLIQKYFELGKTYEEIAKLVGVSKRTIIREIKKLPANSQEARDFNKKSKTNIINNDNVIISQKDLINQDINEGWVIDLKKLEIEIKKEYIKTIREYKKAIKDYEDKIKIIENKHKELIKMYEEGEKLILNLQRNDIENIRQQIYDEIDTKNLLYDIKEYQNNKLLKFNISDEKLFNLILKFKQHTYDANLNYWENLESLTNTIVKYLKKENNNKLKIYKINI